MATFHHTFVMPKFDLKRQDDRSGGENREPSDATERRSQAFWQLRISRRRPLIGDVELNRFVSRDDFLT